MVAAGRPLLPLTKTRLCLRRVNSPRTLTSSSSYLLSVMASETPFVSVIFAKK